MVTVSWFIIVLLFIAVISDICFHKIPNWLTYPTMIMGIIYYSSVKGFEGFLFSLGGLGVGIGIMTIFYLMGGMGAGDAKLMGAVGGLLGPRGVFVAFLFTAITGGIYALMLLAYHGHIKELVKGFGAMLKTFGLSKEFAYIPPTMKEKKPKLCYGVAIALGTFISIVWGSYL